MGVRARRQRLTRIAVFDGVPRPLLAEPLVRSPVSISLRSMRVGQLRFTRLKVRAWLTSSSNWGTTIGAYTAKRGFGMVRAAEEVSEHPLSAGRRRGAYNRARPQSPRSPSGRQPSLCRWEEQSRGGRARVVRGKSCRAICRRSDVDFSRRSA